MSKAFTRENDADEEDDAPSPVPSGKNYITPEGLAALRAEYDHLFTVERPEIVEVVSWAAGNGDRSENGDYLYGRKRLREIDRRLSWLSKRMQSAIPVDPAQQTNRAQVFFGATVTYADDAGEEQRITIVGQDEMDASAGRISWVSPLARALMKSRVGDVVSLQSPRGLQELEILAIDYPPDSSRRAT